MDMSLDEMAKNRRSSGRGGRGGRRGGDREERQVGKPRNNNGNGGERRFGGGRGGKERRRGNFSGGRLTPYSRAGTADSVEKWGHEGFDKLAREPSPPRQPAAALGFKVKITNLHYDVIEEDLEDLFGTVGKVLKTKVEFDSAGRSTGNATVILASESSVQKAIDEFDGRAIDGQKMKVEEDGTVSLGEKKRPQPRESDDRRGGDDVRPRGRGFNSGTRGLLGEFAKDDSRDNRRNNRDERPRGRGNSRFDDDELKNLKVKVSF